MRAFVCAHAGGSAPPAAPPSVDGSSTGDAAPLPAPPAPMEAAASTAAAAASAASTAAAAAAATAAAATTATAAAAAATAATAAATAASVGAAWPIRIEAHPIFGRHAVAARPLAAGELVLIDTPFGDCVTDECAERVCHRCYGPLPATPHSCEACGQLHACSAACFTALHDVHAAECDVLASVGRPSSSGTGGGLASLRLYLRMLRRARTDPAAFAEVEAMAEHYDAAPPERRRTLDEQVCLPSHLPFGGLPSRSLLTTAYLCVRRARRAGQIDPLPRAALGAARRRSARAADRPRAHVGL